MPRQSARLRKKRRVEGSDNNGGGDDALDVESVENVTSSTDRSRNGRRVFANAPTTVTSLHRNNASSFPDDNHGEEDQNQENQGENSSFEEFANESSNAAEPLSQSETSEHPATVVHNTQGSYAILSTAALQQQGNGNRRNNRRTQRISRRMRDLQDDAESPLMNSLLTAEQAPNLPPIRNARPPSYSPSRFYPQAIHYDIADRFGFNMSRLQPGAVRFDRQNVAGASSQDTYEKPLSKFWDFLSLLGREEEQFVLLYDIREKSPAITPASLCQFLMYKNQYRKKRGEEFISYNGRAVLDKNGNKVPIIGGWGGKGSFRTFRIFLNAVNNKHNCGVHDKQYVYKEQSGLPYDFGNPTSTPVVANFVVGEKKNLATDFKPNAKQALSPIEYQKLQTELTREGRRKPGWLVLSMMFGLEVDAGMRYGDPQNLKYGDLKAQLCRLTEERNFLRTIGFEVNGKTENLGARYIRGGANVEKHFLQISYNQ